MHKDPIITTTLVQKLITTQFSHYAHLPITPVPTQGHDNRSYRLGPHLLIRLPSSAAYSAQVLKEQQWLPLLAPHLPLPVPTPVTLGSPTADYPFSWSIYQWIEGSTASTKTITDLSLFAADLAQFLTVLQSISADGGPAAGKHNFYRGGPLSTYNRETRAAIALLPNTADQKTATIIWNRALSSSWDKPPVWVHGDVAMGNLLTINGRLSAIIDFGCMAIGDPACDLVIAWNVLDKKSREVFKQAFSYDDATWHRAHGWALWKALISNTLTLPYILAS
ncbi:MAG: aminoglycoside phosphotransferase family protein [bacterium]